MIEKKENDKRSNRSLVRLWRFLVAPSASYSILAILFAGFFAGIIFWGGFNWAMELSNTETFCISCHEMREYVYEEYRDTIHYSNRTGVRATCPDCHVPKLWIYKFIRKIQASNELFHKLAGSINTPQKFEAKRLELAKHVWTKMKATDSRECRNCHEIGSMDFDEQQGRARRKHEQSMGEDKTCIDCHKGIAHSLPEDYDEEEI